MPDKVLFVDDDPAILTAYQRALHKHVQVDIAPGGAEGLEKIKTCGPYSVVVTDIQMPGMGGIEFLTRTNEIAPDTVRMVLTGNAGLKSVMDALEHGSIFRYLTKPVPPDNMLASLEAGVKQYNLQVAERDLLEKTLQGSIKVMLDILSTVNPEIFGRAQALKASMRQLAIALGQDQLWRFELGAMLAQIGMVTIPPTTLYKVRKGQALGPIEEGLLKRSPEISHGLIVNIPR
ncbi:MAG: response regulator receiver, partial [Capsulimonas sp.]|nr:response regulator receiver [Capsulimonas sp.]